MANIIECRNLWKIFGNRAKEAMSAILNRGVGKREILDEFSCAVGVVDASFSVSRGEIFCIMGLSGSGKSTLIRHVNRLIEPTSGEVSLKGATSANCPAANCAICGRAELGWSFKICLCCRIGRCGRM